MALEPFQSGGLARTLAIALASALVGLAHAADGNPGKAVALDKAKGNCLACHAMPGIRENVLPGNVGMPLVNVKSMVASKRQLRAHIWDESKFNPNTVMPPFGKHRILTEKEVSEVTDFIYGL